MKIFRRKVAALSAILTHAALIGSSAWAQTPGPSSSVATPEKVEKIEKLVVTGSRIPTNETAFTAGTSPVIRIDRQVIEALGLTTTAEVLQKLSISNGGAIPIANNAIGFTPGGTAVSLRGLGTDATLVLINGRRVAVYPLGNQGDQAFVDLNSIPLAAIDSVEVLKDGASAIYGADAVAGVVNIKMRRGLDGSQLRVSYGNTTNKDSGEFTAALITGAHTNQASAMVGFSYYRRNAIFNRDRSYSAIPPYLSANSSPYNLQITPAAALAAGVTLPPALAGLPSLFVASPASSSNQGLAAASTYRVGDSPPSTINYNEFSMAYPRRENRGVFAYADRKIFGTDNIRLYVDAAYQRAATENQLAPAATGNFTTAGRSEIVIPARTSSPIPLPDGRGRAAPNGAFNPFNPFNQDLTGNSRARLVDFGNRIFRDQTDALLLTAGVKAEDIMGKWNFDGGYSYSSVRGTARNTLVSTSRFNRLLNANDSFFKPGSADYLGTTQPFNPFGYYQVPIPGNAQLIDAARAQTKDVNESRLSQLNAVIATDRLLDLPAGPAGAALGVDYRQEQLDQYPDSLAAAGDLIGQPANAVTHSQRKVLAFFAEGRIPLLKHAPGAHDLSATLAVRHENFLTHHQTTTVPKVGLRWQPRDESLTLRASWSKGFREPSLYEMFASTTYGYLPIYHPLPPSELEPEQTVSVSGNRRLKPEKTDYLNAGIVWSPRSAGLKGLTLGVDYWEADRKGTVSLNYQDTVDRFFGRHPEMPAGSAPGGLAPGESVILYPDGSINVINSVYFNIGETRIAGFDYSADYWLKTDSAGRFEFNTTWSMFSHYLTRDMAGGEFSEVVNQPTNEGSGSDNGYLRWKGRVQVLWSFKGFDSVVAGNFTDGFWDHDTDGNSFFVRPTWTFDLQVSRNLRGLLGRWLDDTKLTIGARNVLDRDPPFASGYGGNFNGYPGFLYSPEGRFVYVSMTRKF